MELVWRKMYMSKQCQFEICSHHPFYYCITYTRSSLSCSSLDYKQWLKVKEKQSRVHGRLQLLCVCGLLTRDSRGNEA